MHLTAVPDEDEVLSWLDLCWGGSYQICIEGGPVAEWTAYRLDGTGPRLAARTPQGLTAVLRADLAALEGDR